MMTKKQAKTIATKIMSSIEVELDKCERRDQIKILEELDDLLYILEEDRYDSYRP